MFPGPVIRVEIPGNPKGVGRVKARAFTPKGGGKPIARVYTPAATATEAGVIRMYGERAMGGAPPLQHCLSLRMTMFMAIPKSMSKKRREMAIEGLIRPGVRPDCDNSSKFVDALKGVVHRDDCQFTEWLVWKRYAERPRVVMEIREVSL